MTAMRVSDFDRDAFEQIGKAAADAGRWDITERFGRAMEAFHLPISEWDALKDEWREWLLFGTLKPRVDR